MELQNLIGQHAEAIKLPKDGHNRKERVEELERVIKCREQKVKERVQRQFVEQAVHFRDDQMMTELQRHLKPPSTSGAVIQFDDKVLFNTADIVHGVGVYYQRLLGHKQPLRGDPAAVERVTKILEDSHRHDSDPQNRLFVAHELEAALKHFSVTKAKGLDELTYKVLRVMGDNNTYFIQTLLSIINTIYTLSTYPDRLNGIRLVALKKVDVPTTFRDYRGLTILSNLKSITHFMRFQRIRTLVEGASHGIQAV